MLWYMATMQMVNVCIVKIYNNNTGHYGDYDIQQMINYEYDAKGNMTTVSDSLNNSKVMARYTYDSNDNFKFCHIWQWYIYIIYI